MLSKFSRKCLPKNRQKIPALFLPCSIELLSTHFNQSKPFLYNIYIINIYLLYIYLISVLPRSWKPQPLDEDVHLVALSSSSIEYQKVINLFGSAIDSVIVQKIERIQNPRLYKMYISKKESMGMEANEKQLFHGTKSENVSSINTNNFNRRFSGINGKNNSFAQNLFQIYVFLVRHYTDKTGHGDGSWRFRISKNFYVIYDSRNMKLQQVQNIEKFTIEMFRLYFHLR